MFGDGVQTGEGFALLAGLLGLAVPGIGTCEMEVNLGAIRQHFVSDLKLAESTSGIAIGQQSAAQHIMSLRGLWREMNSRSCRGQGIGGAVCFQLNKSEPDVWQGAFR